MLKYASEPRPTARFREERGTSLVDALDGHAPAESGVRLLRKWVVPIDGTGMRIYVGTVLPLLVLCDTAHRQRTMRKNALEEMLRTLEHAQVDEVVRNDVAALEGN